MWCSRECERVTGLFEVISGGGVRDEVVEEVGDEVVEEVDTGVCGLTIGVKGAVINGVAAGISDRGPLLLCVKKSDKDSSDGSTFVLDSPGLTDGDELEGVNLTFLNEQAGVSEIDFVQGIGRCSVQATLEYLIIYPPGISIRYM